MCAYNNKIDAAPLIGSNATATSQYDLHRDVAVATWSIGRNQVTYEKQDSHTLSLYLKGGETSFRQDQIGNKGRAGTFCLMPQGQRSTWQIGGPIDFAHLYFSDRILKQYVADRFDRDVRLFELTDLTYREDRTLRNLVLHYLSCCQYGDDQMSLHAEQLLYQIFEHLISAYNGHDTRITPISGGLAPKHIRLLKAVIADQMDRRLSIQGLAAQIGLSPFHFARQFKESFGEAPAQYVSRQRINAVKRLLIGTDTTIASIAAQTGFAQQSHMTAQFKRHTGQTPNSYRQAVKS